MAALCHHYFHENLVRGYSEKKVPRKIVFSFVENAMDMCGNSNEKLWKIWSYLVVHLMYPPTHLCQYGNNTPNLSVSRNWCKCLIIINSLYLRESMCHKPGLVFLYSSISNILGLVKPYISHK
jgi:hypothetical protein